MFYPNINYRLLNTKISILYMNKIGQIGGPPTQRKVASLANSSSSFHSIVMKICTKKLEQVVHIFY